MTSHQVALTFEDGVTRFIRCAEDQTVADASYRSRINIPLDCRDGACGTCKAFCESGEYDGGAYIEDALSADEAADGFVLPCSMKPRSDLVLQVASTSEVAKTQAATYTGRITELTRLSLTTVAFTLDTPDRDRLAFLPGQYVNIAVPGVDETRSYSFSSAPDDKQLTFLVKLTPGGVMSTWLTEQASIGDGVTFTGPNGSFFLREAERPLLLLAGGTGLAPILSILRRLRDCGSTRPVHLVYGVGTDDDLVELDLLEELAAALPALTWDHCVADPASSATNKGYVMSLIRPEHLYGGDVAVYLCGPPPMVEAVRAHFAEQGVVPTGFYYEKFALSGAAPSAPVGASVPAEPVETPAPEPLVDPLHAAPLVEEGAGQSTDGRAVAGQLMLPTAETEPVDAGLGTLAQQAPQPTGGRTIAGQVMFPPSEIGPVNAPPLVDDRALRPCPNSAGSYEIGEEHPSVHQSDAIFEARRATWCHPNCAQDHLDIVDAVAAGDRQSARALAVEHAERSKATMRWAMEDAGARVLPAFVTPGRFDGKVVLVTGAAQGIGERTARRISAEGGTLVLADRSDLVEGLAEELTSTGRTALPVVADLEAWTGAEAVVASALARFGRVDVAIHTVGGTIRAKPFEQYPPDQIEAEINRSLYPTLWSCRAVVPHMLARRSGTIVNVSSVATRGLNRVPYAAAKGGVNAITSALALEAAPYGVRVVATAPGGTDAPPRRILRGPGTQTAQEREWYQTIVDQTVDSSLMKRYGTLDEQAAAITFLASEEASYITGTVLPVAGGDLG
jgi:benzoate/toluate 1,2-dioxygenase reductase subunit